MSSIKLPETSKVTVREREIFIISENGSEEYWGNVADKVIEEIAYKMELELQTILNQPRN